MSNLKFAKRRVGRNLGEVAGKLRLFYSRKGRMPSYAEFAREISVKSKNAVLKWVGKLVEAGVLTHDASGRMAKGERFSGVAVLGLVEAGFPTGAEETYSERQSLDDFLIGRRENTYMLTVKGDSMIDASIREGDLVIVERGVEPKSGDIVIAEVDGNFTMKYFRKRGKDIYLEAANSKYKPIRATEELKVTAVVRAVIRKYV